MSISSILVSYVSYFLGIERELLTKRYLRVPMSMTSAHGQVVFVCEAGEVTTVDRCSGCEAQKTKGEPSLTELEWSPSVYGLRMLRLSSTQMEYSACSIPGPVSKWTVKYQASYGEWMACPYFYCIHKRHTLLVQPPLKIAFSYTTKWCHVFNFSSPTVNGALTVILTQYNALL